MCNAGHRMAQTHLAAALLGTLLWCQLAQNCRGANSCRHETTSHGQSTPHGAMLNPSCERCIMLAGAAQTHICSRGAGWAIDLHSVHMNTRQSSCSNPCTMAGRGGRALRSAPQAVAAACWHGQLSGLYDCRNERKAALSRSLLARSKRDTCVERLPCIVFCHIHLMQSGLDFADSQEKAVQREAATLGHSAPQQDLQGPAAAPRRQSMRQEHGAARRGPVLHQSSPPSSLHLAGLSSCCSALIPTFACR